MSLRSRELFLDSPRFLPDRCHEALVGFRWKGLAARVPHMRRERSAVCRFTVTDAGLCRAFHRKTRRMCRCDARLWP